MPDGPLSLPARLHLLAWDSAGREATGAPHLHHLVRAGALTELARRGLLADDDGIATPADPDAHTGDPVLDGLLELVGESFPHRWRTWVTLRARVTLDAVREQLVAEGFLRAERKRVLGVFPSVDHTLRRTAAAQALREEVRHILTGPVPASRVPARDAAVAVLAAAAGLRALPPAGERAGLRTRVEELTDRAGDASPALSRVVRELRTAVGASVPPVPVPAGG
ncbi:hypothetical protein GCM10010129_23240 [Streptomyces fumigatiscleroticus]|nr:hypothetical protein GCM10010129_23240 [Streptomyces fumigatiscleroticus]